MYSAFCFYMAEILAEAESENLPEDRPVIGFLILL
jgi:hypothetical protein